jgi:hypothetical protein
LQSPCSSSHGGRKTGIKLLGAAASEKKLAVREKDCTVNFDIILLQTIESATTLSSYRISISASGRLRYAFYRRSQRSRWACCEKAEA